ncbi:MliC family protein [Thiofilum flexile]|uniref:MliC family protein n=1 Tax=Thiofilum flexile TaxID=125627 RepID=UPI00035F64DA|nr:MliC family protein [Thiofilum flexile]
MNKYGLLIALVASSWIQMGVAEAAQEPSFTCKKVESGSIAELICKDKALVALDLKLAGVYKKALKMAANEPGSTLKAEQRGWIKGRDDCWKSTDKTACVRESYQQRIAELQARYRLVSAIGPVRYGCGGNAANEVTVTFFKTEPATLIAERGDSVSLMYVQPSGSGARYQGRNESFWEHHGGAMITWGAGAPEMHCEPNTK